jgi:hypothetical protein
VKSRKKKRGRKKEIKEKKEEKEVEPPNKLDLGSATGLQYLLRRDLIQPNLLLFPEKSKYRTSTRRRSPKRH